MTIYIRNEGSKHVIYMFIHRHSPIWYMEFELKRVHL